MEIFASEGAIIIYLIIAIIAIIALVVLLNISLKRKKTVEDIIKEMYNKFGV